MLASFVGMMLVVVAGLARHALVDMPTVVLAVLAFLALYFTALGIKFTVESSI